MSEIAKRIRSSLLENGAYDVGFCKLDTSEGGFSYAISVVVKLSESVIDEINGKPTHTYFNHYRSVNSLIDSLLLKAGIMLDKQGYKYITVAASQTVERKDNIPYGRYSHKKVARLCGLGSIGKNALFLHKKYGPAVRLGTLLTNCEFDQSDFLPIISDICSGCDACVKACPALCISGESFLESNPENKLVDAVACSMHMKKEYMQIGRGSVCGICINVCNKRKSVLE